MRAGARLEASEFTESGMSVVGMESRDLGSSTKVTSCKNHEFGSRDLNRWTRGAAVWRSNGAVGHLDNCTLAGSPAEGLYVMDAGSHANATSCRYLQNRMSGVAALFAGAMTT